MTTPLVKPRGRSGGRKPKPAGSATRRQPTYRLSAEAQAKVEAYGSDHGLQGATALTHYVLNSEPMTQEITTEESSA